MVKKILLSSIIILMISGTCYGKPYVEYDLNTSPAMSDTALGVTDPLSLPGWTFRNYLWSDIFALYLTQDFVITGAFDSSGASSNISGPIELTPIGTLPASADGKIFSFTGLAGFLGNSVFGMYDGATPVYHMGFETPPTTLGDYMSFNPTTGKWDVTPAPTGGTLSITEQATQPSFSSMSTGDLVVSYDDDTISYKSATGGYRGTWVYTLDPVTYTLTLSVVDDGTITIGGTPYTSAGSPHAIAGLSGVTAITGLYGGSNDTLTWTGSASVTGSYDTYSTTISADTDATATFSTASVACSGTPTLDFDGASTNTWLAESDNYYVGAYYTPVSAINVCNVEVKLSRGGGDLTGKTVTVKIWSLTGDDLDTLLGTSDTITGEDFLTPGFFAFNFATSTPLTGSVKYAITVDIGGVDAVNQMIAYYGASVDAVQELFKANIGGVVTGSPTFDWSVKVYGE